MGTIHRWRWGPNLEARADREAAPARVAVVDRHVADCPDCAADLRIIRRMKGTLARLAEPELDAGALDRLRSQAAKLGS